MHHTDLDLSAQEFLKLMSSKAESIEAVADPVSAMRAMVDQLSIEHGFCDLPTGGVDRLTIESAKASRAIRLFRPYQSEPAAQPILVFLHGGGFVAGSLNSHHALCQILANDGKCAVASIEYRLAPEHAFPAAVEDAIAGFDWIVEQASRLGLDADRIAVGGDSAGGNLAAVICQSRRDQYQIRMQLLLYPFLDPAAATDSRRAFATGYGIDSDQIAAVAGAYAGAGVGLSDLRFSPGRATDCFRLPPTHFVVAGHDPLKDEALDYAAKLRAAKVAVSVDFWPGQIHGFCSFMKTIPEGRTALRNASAALQRLL